MTTDEKAREYSFILCCETAEAPINGVCLHHNGDACLIALHPMIYESITALREQLSARDREIDKLRARECRHGWRGSCPENGGQIVDRCPTCGGRTLFIGDGGHLTCGNLTSCDEPGVTEAVNALRAEVEAQKNNVANIVEANDLKLHRLYDESEIARAEVEKLRAVENAARAFVLAHDSIVVRFQDATLAQVYEDRARELDALLDARREEKS